MENYIYYLSYGAALGASAGYAPGPLTTMVLSETIRGGRSAGFMVSLSPLITDAPIIAVLLLIFQQASLIAGFIPFISFLGAVYLLYLGLKQLKVNIKDMKVEEKTSKGALKKGVIANFLSPNPYLFWIMIGMPALIKAYQVSFFTSLSFMLSFYVCLLGGKMSIALLMDTAAGRLNGNILTLINRFMAFLLIGFGFSLFYDGFDALVKFLK